MLSFLRECPADQTSAQEQQQLRAQLMRFMVTTMLVGALLTLLTSFLFREPVLSIVIGAGIPFIFLALLLVNRGRPQAAGLLVSLVLIVAVFCLQYLGQGAHDVSVAVYPVVVIVASLVLDWSLFLVVLVAAVGSHGLIVLLEQTGRLAVDLSRTTTVMDLVMLAVILMVAAIAIRLVARTLWRTLAQQRAQERALALSNEQLQARTRELEALYQTSIELAANLELASLLQSIMNRAAQLLDARRGGLLLYRPERDLLEVAAHFRFDETPIGTTLRVGEGLAGKVWQMDEPLIVEDYKAWPGHIPELAESIGHRSVIGIRIQFQAERAGVLTMVANTGRRYTPEDVNLLKSFAAGAAVAISNARLHRRLSTMVADLEAKNEELERFTYTVSHDLKSPLITIKGFLQLLQHDIVENELGRAESSIEHISHAADRMSLLLNELLELSRIGRIINPPQTVPLAAIVSQAVELVVGLLDEQNVVLTVEPNLPEVHVDQARLVRVFQNLIENAVKYMGEQPQPAITIGVRQSEEDPVVFVGDNGTGIAPENQERVFEIFRRFDSASDGTGIGLALVRRIIDVHGGRIWVESDGEGQGSCFCFTLPSQPG